MVLKGAALHFASQYLWSMKCSNKRLPGEAKGY